MSVPGQSQAVIHTPRLELHHMCSDDLIALFESAGAIDVSVGKPYANPHRLLMDDSGPLRWRVPQVKADPAVNKWFVRWMVATNTRDIIGSASFHGPPNEDGMMEIGLGVYPSFHRQGFATEALIGMWSWVIDQPGVHTLRYTVDPLNEASVGVIRKLGFTHMGQQIDEEDGPEDIYEMSATDFRRRLT
jgi:RimJ/RimL family protein N-acetyltransferase